MAPKKNPLKLNKLQLRTLTLAQLLAQDPNLARRDETTGAVTLLQWQSPPHRAVHGLNKGGEWFEQSRGVVCAGA
jgi:hypothetical protein